VSLTFSIVDDRAQRTDQLVFDPHTATIVGVGPHAAVHRRASVVRLAGEFGNAGTIDLLDGLLRRSHCRRVREAAVDAAMRLCDTSIGERTRVIERALRDSNELVRRRAEIAAAQLDAIKSSASS
jgi:HEAT repeat protein